MPPLLRQLVARAKRTGRRIVLVIDNGRPFSAPLAQTALEEAKPWVRTFELPLYTSETLNWIVRFWGVLKDTYFSSGRRSMMMPSASCAVCNGQEQYAATCCLPP